MLGHMVEKVLRQKGLSVLSTSRDPSTGGNISFDVGADSIETVVQTTSPRYIVNAIGIIKPRIDESNADSVRAAVRVNGLFPYELSDAARSVGAHVIQIATDCVYSGTGSFYAEDALHDPTDVYGKSKSLGEVPSDNVLHLRASIIGPEAGRSTSLWEWVRGNPEGAQLNGFTNHLWNGVTTYHFGLVCAGLISSDDRSSGVRHLVPGDAVTKAELVRAIAAASGRGDLEVVDVEAATAVNRTLSTLHTDFNSMAWRSAGFSSAPGVVQMVAETPLA
jgi:dTDP-4-dehydrorhamnose reductase